ncbi:hypothetical protein E9228_002922 [Curtobacterium flaccumfaciens]|uniref:Uncharacterized protein n=1 Tax=Curtobacterium salicis TaxID=1779862 RepID=A0ABX0TDJ9_9MICO|nr:hypothetical protein [Curtobacterium sp. WW7]NII42264.1 hypothetical protein [Curtobacterium sp. WW7]
MSADIQQARAALAKWRKGSTPGPWGISATSNELRARDPWNGFLLGTWANASGADQALIVGTAGNPELWDSLDGMLKVANEWKHGAPSKNVMFVKHAERIAAAIIAADEAMSR